MAYTMDLYVSKNTFKDELGEEGSSSFSYYTLMPNKSQMKNHCGGII
jgi:hypothetical protein